MPAASRMGVTEVRAPAARTIEVVLRVLDPQRWDLDDPFLYRVSVDLATGGGRPSGTSAPHRLPRSAGHRRVLPPNGRRILLRSSHTGNHSRSARSCPERDMMRRDFINAKATGFNMIRFMSGIGWPEQLDLCDELGLMIFEEPGASWLLKDSPQMTEIYDRSLREISCATGTIPV